MERERERKRENEREEGREEEKDGSSLQVAATARLESGQAWAIFRCCPRNLSRGLVKRKAERSGLQLSSNTGGWHPVTASSAVPGCQPQSVLLWGHPLDFPGPVQL